MMDKAREKLMDALGWYLYNMQVTLDHIELQARRDIDDLLIKRAQKEAKVK